MNRPPRLAAEATYAGIDIGRFEEIVPTTLSDNGFVELSFISL